MTSPPPDASSATSTSAAAASSSVPIGIDVGHSYACVGVWRHSSVDVIANDLGSRSTPVLLSFTDKETLFGEAAQSQLAVNLRHTVHHAKRLLGLPYAHPAVQALKAHVDYAIVPSTDNPDDSSAVPLVAVQKPGGEEARYRSDELLGLMLARMKSVADRYCGSDCRECVLAVPSYFSSAQRKALEAAAQQAGLTLLAVLNEPTAAAIAFGLDLPREARPGTKSKENIAVVDVGGATSSVTILQSDLGILTQKAACHELHLGGDDFDALLVDHFSREFQRSTSLSLSTSHRAVARLSVAVEKAKRVLSSSMSASIELDGLYEGEDFYSKISRARFETLAAPLLRRIAALIQRALQKANLSPLLIDHVCLIGGSARMPRLAETVKAVLAGKEPRTGVNSEEAVAVGCTVQASLLAGRAAEWAAVRHEEEGQKRGDIALARGIGVEGDDGVVQRLLDQGTTVPTHTTFTLSQHRAASSSPFLLRLLEGERALAKDNRLLAALCIPASAPSPLTVSVTIDKQRKTYVRAHTGKTVHAELTLDASLTSDDDSAQDGRDEHKDDRDCERKDALYLERSASRTELYDWLMTVKEPRDVVDAAWNWLEGKGRDVQAEDEKTDVWADTKAELEAQVEAWTASREQRERDGAKVAPADVDDVDDYVASMSLTGEGSAAAGTAADDGGGGGGDDEFEHEIADLD